MNVNKNNDLEQAVHRVDERDHDDTSSLRGTMFSVMMVGAFIGGLWIAVFWLFMSRV